MFQLELKQSGKLHEINTLENMTKAHLALLRVVRYSEAKEIESLDFRYIQEKQHISHAIMC